MRGKNRNPARSSLAAVNLSDLERLDVTAEAGLDDYRAAKLLARKDRFVKVLGNGTLSKKLTVSAHAFSVSAKNAIEKAGGKTVVLPMPERKGAKPRAERTKSKPKN